MRRKSLFLLLLAPLLLIFLLTQLAGVQGAPTLAPAVQEEPLPTEQPADEALANAGVPLTQPLSIRIRRQVPITLTIALPAAPVTTTLGVTIGALLTPTDVITVSQVLTDAETVSDAVGELVGEVVPITLSEVLPEPATSPLTVTAVPVDVPDALTQKDLLTAAEALTASFGMTLDVDIQVVVSDTMTSTVPAVLILKLSGMPTLTVPIAIEFGSVPTATVFVIPADQLTVTEEVTDTGELTISEVITLTPGLTLTEEATPDTGIDSLTVVTVTVPVTANIRSSTDIADNVVRAVAPGTVLEVVARNETTDWLLLREGNWLAVVVLGQAPADLPIATDELVEALRAAAALITPTPTPVPPTATPAPVIVPAGPVTGTTINNANLRSGPGVTFDIIGATVPGQTIVIVGRTDAGDWYLLDNGAWISVPLVTGAPPLAAIAVVDPNAPPTPIPPTAAPTPTPDTAALPTATPGVALPTATPQPAPLSVDENLYLVDFDNISANYDRALSAVDRLVASAGGNAAVFADPQWITDMNTAIQLLSRAGEEVARMTVPDRFAAAHNSLLTAADQYNTAANLLSAGVTASDTAQFDAAFASITLANASIAQASAALSGFRP